MIARKKKDDKQQRLDEIAKICEESDRSPIRDHSYYSGLFWKILKLAKGE